MAADPSLLAEIPGSGDGLTLSYDPATTARVAGDPALAADAVGLAVGLYTLDSPDPSATPTDDLAVVSVVRLRDPGRDEAWFRDWRDTYDEAACAQAGGVVRRAQTDIGGRTFFIGSCAGGAFTYHVRTDGGGIVVSLTSVGADRVGQAIVNRFEP